MENNYKSVKNLLRSTVLQRFKYRYFFGPFFPKLGPILILFCNIAYSVQIRTISGAKDAYTTIIDVLWP